MAQEVGQEIQGVVPLVQTPTERIRMVKLSTIMYRTIRSFVESSIKPSYEWRTALEYPEAWIWRKEGKWMLTVYRNVGIVKAEELPVRGIFKVTSNITPFAVLSNGNEEVWFIVLHNMDVGLLYNGKVMLAFTKDAPVAFIPSVPVPYARPISIYEVIDVLNHYVSF